MTDWKPLGSRPPMTTEEWEIEFDRYKTYPEWQQRQNMSLDEFKYIYFWEWGHRMMGRVVGVFFGGGWAYFTWIHRPKIAGVESRSFTTPKIISAIPSGYQPRMALLFAMGGTQGLVGWWMVKSGLGEDRRGDRNEIRVSPYRLAAHLGMAVGTYSLLTWTGLNVLSHPMDAYSAITKEASQKSALSLLHLYTKSLTPSAMQHAQRTRVGVLSTLALTGGTILSGAFVAGNDAGNAYNTYPLMNDQFIPWDDMVNSDLTPKWRNMFETTATVQWNHRALGTSTALTALGVAGYGLLHPAGRNAAAKSVASITPQAARGLLALGTAATAQMSLGIATLLNYVPISLAACHQLGSLVVLTTGIYSAHSLRYASKSALSAVGGRALLEKCVSIGTGASRFVMSGAAPVSKVASKL
jgi:cytochrome c oxidase assembly protein subunit 15